MAKVIIADDIDILRETCVDVLRMVDPDAQIDEVRTGRELVEHVSRGNYDFVLCDADMETSDAGLVALRTVRGTGNKVPFYVLSSNDVGETALEYGATGFYLKGNGLMKDLRGIASRYLAGAE